MRNRCRCESVFTNVQAWPDEKVVAYFEGMDLPAHNQGHAVMYELARRFREMAAQRENKTEQPA